MQPASATRCRAASASSRRGCGKPAPSCPALSRTCPGIPKRRNSVCSTPLWPKFASHGIAGARVDRIARRAGANKQLIHGYFGSKQELFDWVVTDPVERFHHDVQVDPDDVPAFAGATFDFFTDNPAIVRLGAWHSLEPSQADKPIAAIKRSIDQRVRALQRAQTAARGAPRRPT